MLWLVIGGEFLRGFHILGHTPGAQGVHPSRPRHGLGELDAPENYVLGNQELEPTRFCLIRSPEGTSGIVAIVIALRDDLAVLELQERCEVGAHLRSCRLGLKGQSQGTCPDNFQRDGVSARQFILDFILL